MCCCYETKTKHCELIRKNPNEVHTINTIYLSKGYSYSLPFFFIGNSCTSRIWCLQINTWLWFDWRPLENILFIRYIMSLALNLKNIKCSQFILNTDMKSLHELWPIHDMFNCTINVVFIWYPELQCMVTM